MLVTKVPYDMSIPGVSPGDVVVPVVYPTGQSPSIVNIEILGVKVGLTASGEVTVSFPLDVLGVPEGWKFAIMYYDNPAPIRFQVVDPIGSSFLNTEELKVGLWENAFQSPGGSVKDDFIDLDRFYVNITDASKQGDGEIFGPSARNRRARCMRMDSTGSAWPRPRATRVSSARSLFS